MCTAFRDGFQSVYGARVLTPDFLPAVEAARDAGITWFEAGGGARFQSLYFYCNEDAFAMMDAFRVAAGPDADLQTLARGVTVVGLDSQPSEIIRLHAKLFKKHGITTIRNFDALNDVHNLIESGRAIVDAGLKHQVCVTMMELPPGCTGAHTAEFYEQILEQILEADIPFHAVCFKDASGTAIPSKVYETIRRARKRLPSDTLIHFHTHETAGVSVMANRAALDGGADAIDLSLAPVSGGTSQPDILTMWHALRGTSYDLDIDIDKIREVERITKDCLKDYFVPPEALAVEPLLPWSPMPGGALTANTQMMRDQGTLDRYEDCIVAMSECVRRGGFGTSVTPVSQFYFQQAYSNVVFGPWKKIAEPYGRMVLGYFGKTPVPPDAEIVKLAAEQLKLEPTTEHPLDRDNRDPNKGIDPAREKLEAAGLDTSDENIFIVAACGDKGLAFLKGDGQIAVRKKAPEPEPSDIKPHAEPTPANNHPIVVEIGGRRYEVAFDGHRTLVNGEEIDATILESPHGPSGHVGGAPTGTVHGKSSSTAMAAPPATGGTLTTIKAPMPASVFKINVAVGAAVAADQTLITLEAMKMEMPVQAPRAGTVVEILVTQGAHVNQDAPLVRLR